MSIDAAPRTGVEVNVEGPEASPADQTRAIRTSRGLRGWLFPTGWPLVWLFVGYPIWWLLGLSQAIVPVLSLVMLLAVVRRRSIIVPRGFGFWLLFLAWCVGGLLLLQVNAPGTIPGQSNGRYAVWALRMMWYLCATCSLLYVGNLRRELPLARVSKILGWMFVTVVAGGLAGTIFPKVDFPSVIELVMPHALTANTFVQSLVHPNLAQVQPVLGYPEARPSAPFAYTNTWGLAFACFLPFFVVSWSRKEAGWRRFAAPAILVMSVFPVIQSLNRGLWGALIAMAVFVAVRYAFMGRVRMFVGLLLCFGALGVGIVASPLGGTISQRWSHQHSNEGRTHLGTLTVKSTLAASPVAGFGTTRQVQGNFNTIAGGQTADCPKCSPPSLGTQGQVWQLLFTGGLGGLLSYTAFFAVSFMRGLRLRSPYAVTGMAVLVGHAVTSLVYNVNGPGMLAIMIGVAFVWREGMRFEPVVQPTGGGQPRFVLPTLGGYATLIRRNVVVLFVCTLLGGGAAMVYVAQQGVPTTATTSVALNDEPVFDPGQTPVTIDTDAQLINAPEVSAAVVKATGRSVAPDQLSVTALANSRILHISYTAPKVSTPKAEAGATAAAEAFLAVREGRLSDARARTVAELTARADTSRRTIIQSQTILDSVQARETSLRRNVGQRSTPVRYLSNDINRQVSDLGRLSVRLERAETQPIRAGSVLRGPVITTDDSMSQIAVTTGALLGFVLGVLIALIRDRVSPRLRSRRAVERETGLPVIGQVAAAYSGHTRLRSVAQAAASRGGRAALSTGRSASTRTASAAVDDAISHKDNALGLLACDHVIGGPGVVLFADRRTRARSLTSLAQRVEDAGSRVLGVVHLHRSSRLRARMSETSTGVQDPGLR